MTRAARRRTAALLLAVTGVLGSAALVVLLVSPQVSARSGSTARCGAPALYDAEALELELRSGQGRNGFSYDLDPAQSVAGACTSAVLYRRGVAMLCLAAAGAAGGAGGYLSVSGPRTPRA